MLCGRRRLIRLLKGVNNTQEGPVLHARRALTWVKKMLDKNREDENL
jgi:hypothetical protein